MENKKTKVKLAARCAVFLVIGVLLFCFFQNLLVGKWGWPQYQEQITAPLKNVLTTDEKSDVLFLGTSHVLFGVMPLQIYQEHGLVTSNLGTSNQSVAASYYLLKEVLKKQTPQIVMLDASGLFLSGENDASWRYILDSMPLSLNKIAMAQTYATFTEAKGENYEKVFSALFPFYKYHTRWSELNENDFRAVFSAPASYYQVYNLYTGITAGTMDQEAMNALAAEMDQDKTKILRGYATDRAYYTQVESALYEYSISEENISWLKKIQILCDENGIELVLFKVPSVSDPNTYSAAWTAQRASQAKELAEECELPFLDLLYDVDLGMDWSMDSIDQGKHLNWNGAGKVSAYLGEWLADTYGVPARTSISYDRNLAIYQRVGEMARLQMETELSDYLSRLKEMSGDWDLAVFMSCSNDMIEGLTEADKKALQELGLQTSFDAMWAGEAFFAIIDNNTVIHEADSNRRINFAYELRDGKEVTLLTEGWLGDAKASIKINTVECAVNAPGLNIVVYDNQSQKVLDSVAFDLVPDAEDPLSRVWWNTNNYLKNYEAWLVKNIGKRDVQ